MYKLQSNTQTNNLTYGYIEKDVYIELNDFMKNNPPWNSHLVKFNPR